MLDGRIGFAIGGLALGVGHAFFFGALMKTTIGKRTAELLVEEEESKATETPFSESRSFAALSELCERLVA